MRRRPVLRWSLFLTALSAFLASLSSLGCSSSQPGQATTTFPVGTYTRCAQGSHATEAFVAGSGFESGAAALTLTQSESTVTATYVDQNGATLSFDFTQTTSTSATLASTGQPASGASGLCDLGPGPGEFPAAIVADAGAMTYNQGTVFVSLAGAVQGDAGPCGAQSSPASFWLLCEDRQGGAPSPEPAPTAAAPSAKLPVGSYACSSQIGTHDGNDYGTSGASGTLTLTQTGAEVTAQYSGDSYVAGTLHFLATTATTAGAEANQSLTAPCTVPIPAGPGQSGPSPTPDTLPITAGSLSVNGSALVLSFTGAVGGSSSCSMAVSLICSKS